MYDLDAEDGAGGEYKKRKAKTDSVSSSSNIDKYLDDYYVDVNLDINKMKKEIGEIVKATDKPSSTKGTPVPEEKPEYKNKTQQALRELHRAQKFYYGKRYNSALSAVNKSLAYQETALGYALEGSILYTLGDTNAAVRAWHTALVLDPEMYEVRSALRKYER